MRVVARSVQHLQEIIQRLGTFGSTRTSVVLSSPIIKTSFDLGSLER
jgi:Lrp/AsnC family leucine-responsive transcriptional regulator